MANTTDMLRLMRHAADLLANADPTADYQRLCKEVSFAEGPAIVARLQNVTAAMCTASALLRMVAAAMDDDPPKAPRGIDDEPNPANGLRTERDTRGHTAPKSRNRPGFAQPKLEVPDVDAR